MIEVGMNNDSLDSSLLNQIILCQRIWSFPIIDFQFAMFTSDGDKFREKPLAGAVSSSQKPTRIDDDSTTFSKAHQSKQSVFLDTCLPRNFSKYCRCSANHPSDKIFFNWSLTTGYLACCMPNNG